MVGVMEVLDLYGQLQPHRMVLVPQVEQLIDMGF
jgi:hypothetical protein